MTRLSVTRRWIRIAVSLNAGAHDLEVRFKVLNARIFYAPTAIFLTSALGWRLTPEGSRALGLWRGQVRTSGQAQAIDKVVLAAQFYEAMKLQSAMSRRSHCSGTIIAFLDSHLAPHRTEGIACLGPRSSQRRDPCGFDASFASFDTLA